MEVLLSPLNILEWEVARTGMVYLRQALPYLMAVLPLDSIPQIGRIVHNNVPFCAARYKIDPGGG